ncbi:GntR family transcriptional regulator [Amycolatopsis sp. K13G38]|uniref:GntR family transcriptional regulator n=1 Tax=Amycolatopsis acididurans TaxID=2724524 RepID=A0ABX1J7G9_9PSEU|nr:GntR family transcriptional regulator [Amycolatopsis acididurans]NKQ55519.1 GntR family transcriptional regulator [Amycolatopsis acididurans]
MTYDPAFGRGFVAGRTHLPGEVAGHAREMIISGEVRPGDYLRVDVLRDALGVSNTPVREGLFILQSEGFVRRVPRRGFVVESFTREDLRDLFWAQSQLAGELAARAAKRITSEQLARLEANLEHYEKAYASSDSEALAHLGHLFHREINLAADSHRLALLLGSIVKQLPNRFYTAITGQVEGTRQAHPELLAALRNRQSQKVRTLMADHLLEGADHLIESLEQRGVWNP